MLCEGLTKRKYTIFVSRFFITFLHFDAHKKKIREKDNVTVKESSINGTGSYLEILVFIPKTK